MASWPASLPQDQFLRMTDQIQDTVLRTPMDAGPPTRRNRYTAVVRNVDVRLVLNGTQRQAFDTFYKTTLGNGALAFDWEDPVTDATVSFAFRGPATWTLIRGGTGATRIWETQLQLEIQP